MARGGALGGRLGVELVGVVTGRGGTGFTPIVFRAVGVDWSPMLVEEGDWVNGWVEVK